MKPSNFKKNLAYSLVLSSMCANLSFAAGGIIVKEEDTKDSQSQQESPAPANTPAAKNSKAATLLKAAAAGAASAYFTRTGNPKDKAFHDEEILATPLDDTKIQKIEAQAQAKLDAQNSGAAVKEAPKQAAAYIPGTDSRVKKAFDESRVMRGKNGARSVFPDDFSFSPEALARQQQQAEAEVAAQDPPRPKTFPEATVADASRLPGKAELAKRNEQIFHYGSNRTPLIVSNDNFIANLQIQQYEQTITKQQFKLPATEQQNSKLVQWFKDQIQEAKRPVVLMKLDQNMLDIKTREAQQARLGANLYDVQKVSVEAKDAAKLLDPKYKLIGLDITRDGGMPALKAQLADLKAKGILVPEAAVQSWAKYAILHTGGKLLVVLGAGGAAGVYGYEQFNLSQATPDAAYCDAGVSCAKAAAIKKDALAGRSPALAAEEKVAPAK